MGTSNQRGEALDVCCPLWLDKPLLESGEVNPDNQSSGFSALLPYLGANRDSVTSDPHD